MRTARHFNPHSPCGERLLLGPATIKAIQFQSTLPLRGATLPSPSSTCPSKFQSTLPLRGATEKHVYIAFKIRISIHTPLAGSDTIETTRTHMAMHFNPHSPCGERPADFSTASNRCDFNPHSPCGERPLALKTIPRTTDFNPHSPCGERPVNPNHRTTANQFQSTLPLRGATRKPTGR